MYLKLIFHSIITYENLRKATESKYLDLVLLRSLSFNLIVNMKSCYDIIAVIKQVLDSEKVIPENKWSDIGKWDTLKTYNQISSIRSLSTIRNKLVHRGYYIAFDEKKEVFRLLKLDINLGNDIEIIENTEILNFSVILKEFLISLFNLERIYLNEKGEIQSSYNPTSITSLGFDEEKIQDSSFILVEHTSNGLASRNRKYSLISRKN